MIVVYDQLCPTSANGASAALSRTHHFDIRRGDSVFLPKFPVPFVCADLIGMLLAVLLRILNSREAMILVLLTRSCEDFVLMC